ncbi:MAG: hypothetical protein GXX10_07345 [Clostridiaceae bacterium]|nr:hypothetical protein [Clostridiaceae bacterium]
MKLKKDIVSIFSDFLVAWGYIFIINAYLGYVIYIEPPLLLIFLFSGIIYLLLNIFFSTRITSIMFLSLLGLGALSLPYFYFIKKPQPEWILKFIDNFISLFNKLYWFEGVKENEELLYTYANILMILLITVFSLLFILFYRNRFSFIAVSAMTIAAAFFSYYMTANENRLLFATFCTLSVLSYIRFISFRKKRFNMLPENFSRGIAILCTIPLAVCMVAITLIIPKDPEPIKWAWLDQTISRAQDWINGISNNFQEIDTDFFSLSDAGYNNKSTNKLGGPAWLNNKVVMEVKAERPAYLRGTAYHSYDWSTWTNYDPENLGMVSYEIQNDIGETFNAWSYIPIDDLFPDIVEEDKLILEKLAQRELQKVLFPQYTMEVEFKNISTRTVFAPLKSIMPVKNPDDTALDTLQGFYGTLISKSKLENGSIYVVDYYQPMYGDPLLKKALNYSYKGLYKDALIKVIDDEVFTEMMLGNQVVGASKNIFITEYVSSLGNLAVIDAKDEKLERFLAASLLTEWLFRSEEIYQTYLQVMEDLPERVKLLALDITKEAKTDYEKVIAIEQYLKNNYQYSLNPDIIPPDKDLVDYFLFEEKEGYCTYFATAMTILLRTLGIPARYVEGYILPSTPSEEGTYIVTNKYGHAWVEVYFEGFGWLTFEPTPSYSGLTDYISEQEYQQTMNYIEQSDLEDLSRYYQERERPVKQDPSDINPEVVTEEKKATFRLTWPMIAFISAGLLFLVNYLASVIGKNKIARLAGGKKVMALFTNMVSWLSHISLNIKPGETVMEFSKRVDNLYYFETASFKKVAEIYTKVRYGNIDASKEEAELVEKFSEELKKKILAELGIRRYIPLRRIILGM